MEKPQAAAHFGQGICVRQERNKSFTTSPLAATTAQAWNEKRQRSRRRRTRTVTTWNSCNLGMQPGQSQFKTTRSPECGASRLNVTMGLIPSRPGRPIRSTVTPRKCALHSWRSPASRLKHVDLASLHVSDKRPSACPSLNRPPEGTRPRGAWTCSPPAA